MYEFKKSQRSLVHNALEDKIRYLNIKLLVYYNSSGKLIQIILNLVDAAQ